MDKGERFIGSIWDVLNKMMWLDKCKMKESLKGYQPSEIHCIEYIGNNADTNVTKLAEAFYITRSATSKITTKLIGKGIIESYQKSENRKEVYYSLTEQGKTVFKIHEELHKEFQDRDRPVFEQIGQEEFDSMMSFIEKYSRHLDAEMSGLGVDTRPDYMDRL